MEKNLRKFCSRDNYLFISVKNNNYTLIYTLLNITENQQGIMEQILLYYCFSTKVLNSWEKPK